MLCVEHGYVSGKASFFQGPGPGPPGATGLPWRRGGCGTGAQMASCHCPALLPLRASVPSSGKHSRG